MNDSDYDKFFNLTKKSGSSTTEYMMKYCRKQGYLFQLLLHDPIYGNTPVSETYHNEKEEPHVQEILDFNEKELDLVRMNIDIGRVAKGLNDHQKYMLGFAWVIPDELQLLEAFPHVIMIDTTEKTNN